MLNSDAEEISFEFKDEEVAMVVEVGVAVTLDEERVARGWPST